MTREELIQHLQSIVDTKQRLYSKQFAPRAMYEVRQLIIAGVDRMADAQRNSASSIELAEQNLEFIISACYDRSHQRHESEISLKTFIMVRMKDCPKWPYC